MASNLTPRELRTQRPPRNVVRTVGILLLILLGVYVLIQYLRDESDPDRPPIIISSGSVLVESKGDWEDKGDKGYKHTFHGKSVKTFSASTGTGESACTVEDTMIVVTYGSSDIEFTRKGKFLGMLGKNHAFAQFAHDAEVSHPDTGQLRVNTESALVSFRNEDGTRNCSVQGNRIEIAQKH